MLKKYADCIALGCAGLLFLGVGTLIIVVFSLQIDASDKKTYLPVVFGAVFALGGFLAAKFGLSSLLSKAGGRPTRNS
jgi:hypothetical protein